MTTDVCALILIELRKNKLYRWAMIIKVEVERLLCIHHSEILTSIRIGDKYINQIKCSKAKNLFHYKVNK